MGGTFQATGGFQVSDFFQKVIKMTLRCILSVNSHLSGFKLPHGPTRDIHFSLIEGYKDIYLPVT